MQVYHIFTYIQLKKHVLMSIYTKFVALHHILYNIMELLNNIESSIAYTCISFNYECILIFGIACVL